MCPASLLRMRIISWNVNGIRAVHRKGFLEWLSDYRPDILCLQETKAWPKQLPRELLEVEGYDCHFSTPARKGYSGVGTYTRIKPLSHGFGFGVERFDAEGRVHWMEFKNFKLYNIYFPNGGQGPERLNYKMDFYDAFLKHIVGERKSGKSVIFCGDVNTAHMEIDLARPKENEQNTGFLPMEREWIDRVIGSGFTDTFRMHHPDEEGRYSWWDYKTRARERNVGWRLDYFFASEDLKGKINDAFILPDVKGSDHCPVGVELG
jgi:exodeoxyribonuclease III